MVIEGKAAYESRRTPWMPASKCASPSRSNLPNWRR